MDMWWWTWSDTNAAWVSAAAGVAAVLVAALFGYLTWNNSRRSKDAQQRASFALQEEETAQDSRDAMLELIRNLGANSDRPQPEASPATVRWRLEKGNGDQWLAVNTGNATAYNVRVAGLTDLDNQDITPIDDEGHEIEAGDRLPFYFGRTFASPAVSTAVISWQDSPDGPVRSSRKMIT